MSPDQIVAAMMLLLSPEPDPAFDALREGGHDGRYPVEIGACPQTTEAFDIEGHTIVCGTVSVPENYDAPEGNRVPLRFALGASHSTNPFPDPVIYLHGGPAGGALDTIGLMTGVILQRHRSHRDVISFDQRAAMLSSTTVRCYDEMADNIVGIARIVEDAPPSEGEDPFTIEQLYKPCIDEIYSSDADLSQYNTENNARDVRALMSALGYPEYNILGISYGTRLALEVLRTAPEGVRSVIIDGVAPPTVKLYEGLFPPHADAMDALFDQCAADAECDAAYPELREKFVSLAAKLTDEPVLAARGRPEVNADLFYTVVNARNAFGETWARDLNDYLPRIIYELAEGDSSTFDWYLDTHGSEQSSEVTGFLESVPALTEDERALATSVIRSAETVSNQIDSIVSVLAQLKHDVVIGDGALDVAEAFDRSATLVLQKMARADAAGAMRDYARFQTLEPTKDTISDWVRTHVTGPDRRSLLDLVSAMTPKDVARTFEIADRDLAPYQKLIESDLGLFIYACQEDFPYNSLAGFQRVNESFPYGVVATPETVAGFQTFFEVCDLFEKAPREGFQEPVVSNVPVLSLGGTNDTQTSWKWSHLAAETLTDARVVIFPNAGHGSSLFSDCGRDMTAKFILDPTAELDLGCVDALLPRWVMPDTPLE